MKKSAWFLLCVFSVLILASCMVARPSVAPPPLKNEVRNVKPGPNHVWITGHWKWSGGRYIWVSGRWDKPRKNQVWVPGHWNKRGRHYVYVKGHWRKR